MRIAMERQKRQLQVKIKSLERAREELHEAKQQFSELEKEMDEKEEELTTLRRNEQQYRNWWLNEIQFTKLLLNKVPNPNRDIELVRTSQAHYLGHY
jgi:DNA-binding transcriptional regulator GbsR (MarR family)